VEVETTRTELDEALRRVDELQGALATRVVIEQAKGVLRERFGLPLDDAFEILRRAARSSRTRIHDLAHRVVEDAETPPEIAGLVARGAR
jgi:AmiR/NasT family two-component response regulator